MRRDQESHAHHEEVIAAVAAKVARNYVRRASWASEQDLYQEALVTAYDARSRWSAEVGVPFQAYAWRACVNHLREWLWRSSSPISFNHHGLQFFKESIKRAGGGVELSEAIVDSAMQADEALDEASFQRQLRDQVHFLLRRGSDEDYVAATRVLLDDEPPRVVAAEMQIPVTRVYRIADRARRLLKSNAILFELWKARTE